MEEQQLMRWNDIPGAPATGTVLAHVSQVPDGGAHLVTLEGEPKPYKIILLRTGDQMLAYVNRCAHFGVPLAEKVDYLGIRPHESFRCSVHYARYRWQDGYCESGDCEGESLLTVPVAVRAGNVVVAA